MPPTPETRIRLVLNGRERVLPAGTSPTLPLLDWLRGPEGAGLTGAKEGCAEGDCGACTVVFEAPDGGRTPVNACLWLLGQAHGRAIRTVEGLRGADGGPHPVARALAEADATQCGFCTPGIVMAAWAWTREGGDPHEALAGNLCRCTGYRPILEAMGTMADDGAQAPAAFAPPAPARFEAEGQAFHLPATLAEALALRAALPGAWLLAGGTDLGLRVSEGRERPAAVIALHGVLELQAVERHAWGFRIGAGVTYARLVRALENEAGFAPLLPYLARLGSRQIRGLGTVGGNLGTASPIGDALPPLIALGAEVEVASAARGVRRLAVEAFLTGYRRNALAPDEVVVAVALPRPPKGALFACEKVSRRHDQDISAVALSALLAFRADGAVASARLAFGGMGPRAARSPGAEAALAGRPFDAAAVEAAAAALAGDFEPLTDWRGGARWRMAAAQGLLRRVHLRRARPDLQAEVHALEVRA